MSITTIPKRKIFNTLTTASIAINGGVISIQGFPDFTAEQIVAGSCYRSCATPCVPQVITITPTVPSSTCECPWMWTLVIKKNSCYGTYRVQEIFETIAQYDYVDPNGATPTVAQIIVSVVAQINSDPSAIVSAVNNGSTTFTLTEKDCDGEFATCGYDAFIQSGSIATTGGSNAAHVGAILSASEVAREWPILPGSWGTNPETAFCGSYCVFGARISPANRVNDPHLSNSLTDRFLDIEIYINTLAPTFDADWQNTANLVADCWAAEAS